MALEFIGGTLFTLLYDGVKQAMSKSGTFKSLLGDLKSTLDSLVGRDIQQIGDHNVELGLPNEEIEGLKMLMEEGVKLVEKLSNFRLWNYCCLNDYTEQVVELDRALKRLLEKLKMQEARDVKELLVLARQNRDDMDELKRRVLELLQQRAGNVTESSVSGGNAETVREQSQGNGEQQVTSFNGGTSLQEVFVELFDVVIEVKDKTRVFKPLLGDLKSTLDSLKPLIEEIAKRNKVFDRPMEPENFRNQMEKGVELIRKCSKVRLWSSCKQYKYRDKLMGLDESLQKLLNILKVQAARDVKETLVSVKTIEAVIKKIEGSGLVQDQIQTKGWGALPEPLSPRVGLDLVNMQGTQDVKETLVSSRNTKAVVDKIEGSGVVQNQIDAPVETEAVKKPPEASPGPKDTERQLSKKELKKKGLEELDAVLAELGCGTKSETGGQDDSGGTSENHSRNIDSSRGSEFSEAITRPMDKSDTDGIIEETSNLRILSLSATKELRGDQPMPIMDNSDRYDFVGDNCGKEVRLMRDKQTKELVAVKYIERGHKIDDNVQREIINHRSLRHPNIIRLKEVILTPTHLAIVMEYASGGDLFERICNAGRFSEDEARFFFQQLISGVSYCHTMQVCHRDLKLENTLLDGSPAPRLKICGFGYSKSSVLHSQPKSTVGTPVYIAPEVLLRQEYDGKIADVWSCGVTLYVMLVGAYPFEDPDEPRDFRKTIQRILSVRYSIPDSVPISGECLELISRIFVPDPAARITIPEIKNHSWFLKNLPADLMDEMTTGSHFEEPDRPMQSLDAIMQIIAEATVPAAGTLGLSCYMTDNPDMDDDMDDLDSESELDVDSSGEIVYAI